MARRPRSTAPAFDALAIEGALIAPAMLAKIAASDADGQEDASYRIPEGPDPARRDRALFSYRPSPVPRLR